MQYIKSRIVENTMIAPEVYKMKLKVNEKEEIFPGQFFMLKGEEDTPILPRPISVNNVEDSTVSFVYEVRGKGTEKLAGKKAHSEIYLWGALGKGFPLEEIKGKVAIVTGGMGIAPMEYLINTLNENREGRNISKLDLYSGFRDKVYLFHDLKDKVDEGYISTDNGAYGHKGVVTELITMTDYDIVLCCGPEKMMEIVAKLCLSKGVKCYVSMEKHMACGVGACLVCTCKTKEGFKRTCKDGPVFSAEELELGEIL